MAPRTSSRGAKRRAKPKGQRLEQRRQLEQQYSPVLANQPAAQILLPNPHDRNTSAAHWRLEISRATRLLDLLQEPDHAQIQEALNTAYADSFQDEDEYLKQDMPKTESPELESTAWVEAFLERLHAIVIITRMKHKIEQLSTPESQDHPWEARVRHRQTALHRLFQAHATPVHLHDPFQRLLPRPEDEAISKRAWEDWLFAVRQLLRLVPQGDRIGSHSFVLHPFDAALRRDPRLRKALPQPETATDTRMDAWQHAFLGAVEAIVTANQSAAQENRQAVRARGTPQTASPTAATTTERASTVMKRTTVPPNIEARRREQKTAHRKCTTKTCSTASQANANTTESRALASVTPPKIAGREPEDERPSAVQTIRCRYRPESKSPPAHQQPPKIEAEHLR
ncbi:unnamed protein product [Symbiodinium sp. CCMP2592]|nr:unnamed protein product [Symbiodinium sp. CCMP2592]